MYKRYLLVVGPQCHLDLKRPSQFATTARKEYFVPWHTPYQVRLKKEKKKEQASEGRLNPSAKVSDNDKRLL
jgi:hypothetical protein